MSYLSRKSLSALTVLFWSSVILTMLKGPMGSVLLN